MDKDSLLAIILSLHSCFFRISRVVSDANIPSSIKVFMHGGSPSSFCYSYGLFHNCVRQCAPTDPTSDHRCFYPDKITLFVVPSRVFQSFRLLDNYGRTCCRRIGSSYERLLLMSLLAHASNVIFPYSGPTISIVSISAIAFRIDGCAICSVLTEQLVAMTGTGCSSQQCIPRFVSHCH